MNNQDAQIRAEEGIARIDQPCGMCGGPYLQEASGAWTHKCAEPDSSQEGIALSDKQVVRQVYPDAQAIWTSRGWRILVNVPGAGIPASLVFYTIWQGQIEEIGRTSSGHVPEAEAWADARSRLAAISEPLPKPESSPLAKDKLHAAAQKYRNTYLATEEEAERAYRELVDVIEGKESVALLQLLEEVKQCCLYAEDDGIGVTTEAHISEGLFERICTAINESKPAAIPEPVKPLSPERATEKRGHEDSRTYSHALSEVNNFARVLGLKIPEPGDDSVHYRVECLVNAALAAKEVKPLSPEGATEPLQTLLTGFLRDNTLARSWGSYNGVPWVAINVDVVRQILTALAAKEAELISLREEIRRLREPAIKKPQTNRTNQD